jgi:ABC-type amino acid transport substrate-binding protein
VFHETDSLGSKFDNGSWSGMTALVSSGTADIGVAAILVTKERSEAVAHTVPLGSVR